jgi:hypothetical protein
MRVLGIVALSAALDGCVSDDGSNSVVGSIIQSSVFAQPTVMYHTGENLEVSYYNGGIQQSFNEKKCHGAVKEGMRRGISHHKSI